VVVPPGREHQTGGGVENWLQVYDDHINQLYSRRGRSSN